MKNVKYLIGKSNMNRVSRSNTPVSLSILMILLCLVSSCANRPVLNLEGPYWKDDDDKPIPEPKFDEPNVLWTSVERAIFDQGLELLDFDRNIRKLSGRMTQAKNVNSFDELPNSSWFTNRHGLPQTRLTSKQIAAGIQLTGGPDTSDLWTVFRPKIGGVTPGFWIEDVHGNQYIIKFDLKGFPELSTGATIISGRFLQACGYNVAQETIVYWKPDKLRVRDGVTYKGPDGKKLPFTMDVLNEILDTIEREPDGSIRSVASLMLGNVKGPFMLKGTRADDPNDWCPHQDRRDLRGLYVMVSLINHYDVKDHNSMDVYVGEPGKGYLKHYQMDFGSSLGAAGYGPKHIKAGYANHLDTRDMGISFLTLGLKKWQWEDGKPWTNRTVGYFESELFHPGKWDPNSPVPTFENMTTRDGYWGAKIVMAFSDEDLTALVKTGQYSDREAEAMILQILKQRRDKIGKYWFGKINPLDYPVLEQSSNILNLRFSDLAVDYGLAPKTATYQYEILHQGRPVIGPIDIDLTHLSLSNHELQNLKLLGNDQSTHSEDSNLFEVRIRTNRSGEHWTKNTIFWLNYNPELKEFKIVGIEHPT